MRIAIRADGGASIGMGHIMRTLVLAKEFAKNNEVFYVCRVQGDISLPLSKIENSKDETLYNRISDKYITGIEKVIGEGFKVLFIREENLLEDLKNINRFIDILN